MSGDIEINRCDYCGKDGNVQRKYFHYAIKCECHSHEHFEIKFHCNNCVPVEPETTKITLKTKQLTHLKADEFKI